MRYASGHNRNSSFIVDVAGADTTFRSCRSVLVQYFILRYLYKVYAYTIFRKYAAEVDKFTTVLSSWVRNVFRIGTVRYKWPMSAHASQAFSIAHCTDSEDLP